MRNVHHLLHVHEQKTLQQFLPCHLSTELSINCKLSKEAIPLKCHLSSYQHSKIFANRASKNWNGAMEEVMTIIDKASQLRHLRKEQS